MIERRTAPLDARQAEHLRAGIVLDLTVESVIVDMGRALRSLADDQFEGWHNRFEAYCAAGFTRAEISPFADQAVATLEAIRRTMRESTSPRIRGEVYK